MIIEEKKIWIPKIRQGNWSKLIGVFETKTMEIN